MRSCFPVAVCTAMLSFLSVAARGATPPSQTVTLTATPGLVTYQWTGTAPPGAVANGGDQAGTGACSTDPTSVTNDTETFTLKVPDGLYGAIAVKAEFKIAWQQTGTLPANPVFAQDALPDLAMTLEYNSKVVSSSDGSVPHEQVTVANPADGTYTVLVCSAIASTSTQYAGTLTITTAPATTVSAPPSAPAQGLEFSASLIDDIEYYAAEPSVVTDPDGTIYTCGPAGSGFPAADYGQSSIDGGDQFNRLGDPTTGRMGLLGGGDCSLATAVDHNSQGNYQLAYAGLSGALSDFTVSTSPDKGQTITNIPNSNSIPVDDRQWLGFSDALNVYLAYKNEQLYIVIHHSSDGGLIYGPATIIAPSSGHVGAMRTMTKDLNPAHNGMSALYFPHAEGNAVALAISLDAGSTWNNCTAATAKGDPGTLFAAMDHDLAGNIYLTYTDQADYNTYLVVIPASELAKCNGGSGINASIKGVLAALPPIQMNRDKVLTSLMPWVAAGGLPGRAAVSFYGSEVAGAPADKTLPFVWDVYVSQTLNALDAHPAVAQVKATTHPMHYDQICVSGTLCATGGDRSLLDFFSMAYNKKNGELDLVFYRSGKKPGDGTAVAQQVAGMSFIRQIGGPSNSGATLTPDANHMVLRQSTTDPEGDAYGGFSGLVVAPTRVQLPALDVTRVSIDDPVDLKTGAPSTDGGFTVTMHLKDLSSSAISSALSQTNGQSLLWMLYYWSGFHPHVAAAVWDGSAFSFSTSGAVAGQACALPPGALLGCDNYPLDTSIDGKVDQAAGTIQFTVPLSVLKALADVPPPARSPAEVAAKPGDRLYSAAAYTFANVTGTKQSMSQSLVTVDNTAAMDFLIPGGTPASNPPPVPAPAPPATPSSSPRFGGSLDLLLLGPMLGALLLRRRTRDAWGAKT